MCCATRNGEYMEYMEYVEYVWRGGGGSSVYKCLRVFIDLLIVSPSV